MATLERRKPISFYKDPYYIPGYCGYYSQLPFQIGETYGTTTYRLLTDPDVAKSGRAVLIDLNARVQPDKKTENEKAQWIRRRNKSWGDKKLNDEMVPGYTGYIPRSEEHFGARYAEICDRSALDHCNHRIKHESLRKELVLKQPLAPIRNEPLPYVSPHLTRHYISPYFQDIGDPEKTFVSGYTGYIPKSRSRFSLGYPIATNEALNSFTKDQLNVKSAEGRPIVIQRLPKIGDISTVDMKSPLYRCGGLLPHYTGYLPGHKYRFGQTYGTSSRYYHCSTNNRTGKVPFQF